MTAIQSIALKRLAVAALVAGAGLSAAVFSAPSADAQTPAAIKPAKVAVPSGTYKLDPTHAAIVFSVKHIGLADYMMRFTKFDATITLDVADPSKSAVTATIDPTSIKTEYPFPKRENFDGKIQGDKFLNAKAFPAITFKSSKVEMTAPNAAKVTGTLDLLGVKKDVTLDVVLQGDVSNHPFRKKPAIGFRAEGQFDRRTFGMTYLAEPKPSVLPNGKAIVGAEVSVTITGEFIKVD